MDARTAFKLLKREKYGESFDLYLRQRIADFEMCENMEGRLDEVDRCLGLMSSQGSDALEGKTFSSWLENLDYRVLFKKLEREAQEGKDKEQITFISNQRDQDEYRVCEINYFIDAPIEIRLIDVIWTASVGALLDQDLAPGCMGNRLSPALRDIGSESGSWMLTKHYFRQYSDWRDRAIQRAQTYLDDGQDVVLIAMDFKQAFYHLQVDWDHVDGRCKDRVSDERLRLLRCLNEAMRQVFERFHAVIAEHLTKTHRAVKDRIGLPIGLLCSSVLANHILDEFDRLAMETLRPSYYGRYVDDVLIVLHGLDMGFGNSDAENAGEAVRCLLSGTGLFEYEDGQYTWTSDRHRPSDAILQPGKFIVHYYDHENSYAGLAQFVEELARHASEFRFLPDAEESRSLSDSAYDLHYVGSINKLRSLVGISENSHKLSIYLLRRIIEHRLTDGPVSDKIVDELFRYLRGRNISENQRLWERVFAFLLLTHRDDDCARLYDSISEHVRSRCFTDEIDAESVITNKLRHDTEEYLSIALAHVVALLGANAGNVEHHLKGSKALLRLHTRLSNCRMYRPYVIRGAQYVRHHLCSWPLLVYLSIYDDSLISIDIGKMLSTLASLLRKAENADIAAMFCVEYAPRYIHYDEYLLMRQIMQLVKSHGECGQLFDVGEYGGEFARVAERMGVADSLRMPAIERDETPGHLVPLQTDIGATGAGAADHLVVGLVNMRVRGENVKKAYDPSSSPNLSYARQRVFFDLINAAKKKPKCDLLVLPEVSVPFAWLPFMVVEARREQIGMVFGLEHVILGEHALNLSATLLPFETSGGYRSCHVSLRLKNHYSPMEQHELARLDLARPEKISHVYDLFAWRGSKFTVFNCFELTDIKHRGHFRSLVDFVVAIECNPDVKYFGHIVASTARDVHCYVIQANSSEYGDSRITAPLSSEIMDLVQVKGGENCVLLKSILEVGEMRDFQSRHTSPVDRRFKPLPAGYRHDRARSRGKRMS